MRSVIYVLEFEFEFITANEGRSRPEELIGTQRLTQKKKNDTHTHE